MTMVNYYAFLIAIFHVFHMHKHYHAMISNKILYFYLDVRSRIDLLPHFLYSFQFSLSETVFDDEFVIHFECNANAIIVILI